MGTISKIDRDAAKFTHSHKIASKYPSKAGERKIF